MSRKFSIIKTVDLDKLDNEIYQYIFCHNNETPYIFMSDDTANAIADTTKQSGAFLPEKDFNTKSKDGVTVEYTGYKVFINNDLKFGIVEIR